MKKPVDLAVHIRYTGLALFLSSQTKTKAKRRAVQPLSGCTACLFLWAHFATRPFLLFQKESKTFIIINRFFLRLLPLGQTYSIVARWTSINVSCLWIGIFIGIGFLPFISFTWKIDKFLKAFQLNRSAAQYCNW